MSPMGGGDDSAQGFSPSVHFYIPLQPLVTCVFQVTDESYIILIITNNFAGGVTVTVSER
jgi:hypothetical protein